MSALRASRSLTPGRFLVLISIRGWVHPRVIVRLEGLSQLKNPTTSWGIKPAAFWIAAQCLNQLSRRNFTAVRPRVLERHLIWMKTFSWRSTICGTSQTAQAYPLVTVYSTRKVGQRLHYTLSLRQARSYSEPQIMQLCRFTTTHRCRLPI
jgi:hypothetical protein